MISRWTLKVSVRNEYIYTYTEGVHIAQSSRWATHITKVAIGLTQRKGVEQELQNRARNAAVVEDLASRCHGPPDGGSGVRRAGGSSSRRTGLVGEGLTTAEAQVP